MNRPIKFRAWHKKEPEEVFAMGEPFSPLTTEFLQSCGPSSSWGVETKFMQFTGLHDKNGKEVYEGDWVADMHGSMGVIEYVEKDMAFKVATSKYDTEGGWTHPIYGFSSDSLEVIGNIYEGKTR